MDEININDMPDGATLTHESCYRALAAKDARFDGVFLPASKPRVFIAAPFVPSKHRALRPAFFSAAPQRQKLPASARACVVVPNSRPMPCSRIWRTRYGSALQPAH